MEYRPALDGLRALAVLAVLAFHARTPGFQGGFLGVDLFFVLSGFLITSLLAVEHGDSGRINLRRFYFRRAVRLYPTLLLMLAAFLAVAPHLSPDIPAWREATWSAMYLADYSRAILREPIVLSHTWSLAVEEHFYLLWPLLVPAILRCQAPHRILLIAYVLATAWRMINFAWLGWDLTYFRFDTRLSGLVLGALIAVRPPAMRIGAAAPLALLAALSAVPMYKEAEGITVAVVGAELASASLVLLAMSARRTWLASPALAYLGRLSYGIYIWHYPAAYWLRLEFPWQITLAGSGLFAVAMAALTYHLIDVPLRRWTCRPSAKAPTTRPAPITGFSS